jgi:Arc/MetJ family transcription regulator
MPTNLAIDDELLVEAQKIGNQATKKSTVTEALVEYIARRKRLKALDAFGKLEFDPNYDYKKDRKRS